MKIRIVNMNFTCTFAPHARWTHSRLRLGSSGPPPPHPPQTSWSSERGVVQELVRLRICVSFFCAAPSSSSSARASTGWTDQTPLASRDLGSVARVEPAAASGSVGSFRSDGDPENNLHSSVFSSAFSSADEPEERSTSALDHLPLLSRGIPSTPEGVPSPPSAKGIPLAAIWSRPQGQLTARIGGAGETFIPIAAGAGEAFNPRPHESCGGKRCEVARSSRILWMSCDAATMRPMATRR